MAVWAAGPAGTDKPSSVARVGGLPKPSGVASAAGKDWVGTVVAAESTVPKAGATPGVPGKVPNAVSPSAPEASGVPAAAPGKIAREGRDTDIGRISLLGIGRPPRP